MSNTVYFYDGMVLEVGKLYNYSVHYRNMENSIQSIGRFVGYDGESYYFRFGKLYTQLKDTDILMFSFEERNA